MSHAESIHSTHEPPNFCLLLMDRTCQCGVAGPSSYWNFPWPIIIHSHGCLPSRHLANSQSQCNKEGKQVKQFSFPLFCLSADGSNQQRVCVKERGRDTMWMFYFPYILSSHTKLFVLFLHLLDSSFLSRPLSSPKSVSMPTTLILRFKITHSLSLVLSFPLSLSLSPSILGFAFLGCNSDLKRT